MEQKRRMEYTGVITFFAFALAVVCFIGAEVFDGMRAFYAFNLAVMCLIAAVVVSFRFSVSSEGAKLELISLAKSDEQKREVAELLSKSRITQSDVMRLCKKFAEDARKNAELKDKQVITDFVNQNK
jgi:hypothetical protein